VTLLDVNILVYAFREDSPDHKTCRDFIQGLMDGDHG